MATFTDMANEWIKNNMPARVLEKVLEPDSHDPSAWAEDFHRWALARCVWRDRGFGGIGALHTDFSEWSIARDDVPCTRTTFERLLSDAGFFRADGLVSGLVLREDLWRLEDRREKKGL